MNLIGPLANPASAGRQVIGVADPARLELIAGALAELGTTHALVVHGEPGLDEISPLGPTTVIELKNGGVSRWQIIPTEHGVPAGLPSADLAGGEPAQNAVIVERVLAADGTPGAEAAVVLNAGAAIYVSGKAATFGEGVEQARTALRAGKGADALARLRRASAVAKA
jgi:anthranilate phosphoribosyltransferase